MKVTKIDHVPAQPVQMEGAIGCTMRCLIGEADGAPSFTMRQFDVAPGGCTPLHSHAYEHEVLVLDGTGVVVEDKIEHKLTAGSVVFVPPFEVHQFRNTGRDTLRFICLIPHPLRDMARSCAAACGCD